MIVAIGHAGTIGLGRASVELYPVVLEAFQGICREDVSSGKIKFGHARSADCVPSETILLIVSGLAAAGGSPASLSAATAIFMLHPARARADKLTPGTGRIEADTPTIVAQFCLQVRKIAISIRMTAITAATLLVSVTNVRYICS
jgi:hypothetical protein